MENESLIQTFIRTSAQEVILKEWYHYELEVVTRRFEEIGLPKHWKKSFKELHHGQSYLEKMRCLSPADLDLDKVSFPGERSEGVKVWYDMKNDDKCRIEPPGFEETKRKIILMILGNSTVKQGRRLLNQSIKTPMEDYEDYQKRVQNAELQRQDCAPKTLEKPKYDKKEYTKRFRKHWGKKRKGETSAERQERMDQCLWIDWDKQPDVTREWGPIKAFSDVRLSNMTINENFEEEPWND